MRLLSDKGCFLEMASKMKRNEKKENELRDLVQIQGLHRKSQFTQIACYQTELIYFPKLTIKCMKSELTYGSYQLSHSLSYFGQFYSRIPVWGGRIISIDGFERSNKFKGAHDYLVKNKWNEAKTLWILEVMEMEPNGAGDFSTYFDLYTAFGRIISAQQHLFAHLKCDFCLYELFKETNQFYFNKDENNNFLSHFSYANHYVVCKNQMNITDGSFIKTPAWLLFDVNNTNVKDKVNCLQVPKEI
jgi:hypothetical protein